MLRDALRDCVRAHLVADVPVGAFLSAGLDSSTLVGFAKDLSGDIRTITFSSEEFRGSEDEEGPLASEVARHFGVTNERKMISRTEFDSDVDAFLQAMDQPTSDGLNTWFVSKAAKEAGLKVALSGVGGDELFGSYSTFKSIPAMVQQYRRTPRFRALDEMLLSLKSTFARRNSKTKSMMVGVARYGGTAAGAYLMERGWIPPWELDRVLRKDVAVEGLKRLVEALPLERDPGLVGLNNFGEVAYLEATRYMRNQLLRDSDWTSMAHSLEIRVPLVDIDLTARVIGLAATGRFKNGKSVLADVVPGGLPAAVAKRPKTGFAIPLWVWLRSSGRAAAWKSNEFLSRPNVGGFSRWAYCIASTIPEAARDLK